MEKQKFIFGFLAILIATAVLIASSAQGKAQETRVLQPEITTKESIQEILTKAKNLGPVRYEVVNTSLMTGLPQQVIPIVTMKVWQKAPYMRFEATTPGTTTKVITHPDAIYFYDATKDKYLKQIHEEMATKFTQKSLAELSKEIKESQTMKELGTEIIDEKLTTIIEYSLATGGIPIVQKLWIWNEKGIPLKSESTMKIGERVTKTSTEYKNFVFEDIPDSVFEVPEDKILF